MHGPGRAVAVPVTSELDWASKAAEAATDPPGCRRPPGGPWRTLSLGAYVFWRRPIGYVPKMAKTRSSPGIQSASDLGF
jgi:hypothetical protein